MDEVGLTADEAEQYDRQIRLWGLEAQKRLRQSTLLLVGMRGLVAEVGKNMVLAGVRSVTVLDHAPLGPEDVGGRFLMSTEGESRAHQAVSALQSLNPNVTVSADTGTVQDKPDEYFKQYDVICASCCTTDTLLRLNELCRANNLKFFCGDVWGSYGYYFADLGEHEYAIDVPKETEDAIVVETPKAKRQKRDNEEAETVTVKKSCSFCSLKDALSGDWSKKPARYFKRTPATFFLIQTLQSFRDRHDRDPSSQSRSTDSEELLRLREGVATRFSVSKDLIPEELTSRCYSELSPVCAVVGGVLAQEIIKAMSGKDRPYSNCFLYDGVCSSGIVESLSP